MYDPYAILRAIDGHATLFMTVGSASLVFNYIYFIAAIVNGRRDRVYPFPLAACAIWFAHDVSYLLLYREWFHVYDHWYLRQFWYGLLPTATIEAIYIWQVWIYGKDELLPGASRGAFLAYILATVLAGAVGWYSLKYFLADPIYAYAFGATGFLALFNIPRLLSRGDAGGQSVVMWVGYVGMQSCWFGTSFMLFGPAFLSPAYLAMAAGCILGGLFMIGACHRLKHPAHAARDAMIPAA